MFKSKLNLISTLRVGTAAAALATAFVTATPSFAIVGNDAYPPSTLVDTTNVTGVGQMVIDQGDGYVGLCTVSLINPRTVIFAAHCVNEDSPSAYGAGNGGVPIGFGFQAYNRTPLINWLNGNHQTSTTDYFYNSNYVTYHSDSLLLGEGLNFLQADIAIATLDTPASNVPTWALLFSPLTEPTHATVVGYGNNGTGTTGYSSLDFRRRIAENTISFLGSLDDMDTFLFGEPDGLPQNLYQLDFNDPKFNTDAANAYDFNIFHDAALQKEAITAPGDSGGPLIVDQLFSQPVIAAVLSGGSRFFSGQKSASYGTTSFYQPLYLYWDWIVANNPYKYVSAKAGNAEWSDPSHWVVDLDPNYMTIVDGELVNALPTEPGQGIPADGDVNSPKFGQVCYFDTCQDIATGEITGPTSGSVATQLEALSAQYTGGVEKVAIDTFAQIANAQTISSPVSATTLAMRNLLSAYGSGQTQSQVTPAASALALPGTSNFVPDDFDGDAAQGIAPRYYDVTLKAAGTTTLSSGTVTIDRLTINGANTGLTIGPDAAMGTYIDTTMYAGRFQVDGLYVTMGDFALMGGVLSGNGTVMSPVTTAVLGAIAPGTVGTTGTLTHVGDVVMSSASGLLIDVAPGSNDRLDVYGTLALGGTLVVTPGTGFKPKYHQSLTIATADDIVGSFNSVPDTITGVLYPTVSTVTVTSGQTTYEAEVVTFQAASYSTLLQGANADQAKVGVMLDSGRKNGYDTITELYDAIDVLDGDTLTGSLDALVPGTARAAPQMSLMMTDAQASFLWQYLGTMGSANESRVAVQGDALKLAQNSQVGSYAMRQMLTGLGDTLGGHSSSLSVAADTSGMALPKGVGAFLIGQKLDGYVQLGGASGKADVDGFLVSVGADAKATDHLRIGAAFSISQARADVRDQPAHSQILSYQLTLYGQYMFENGYFLNGYIGQGIQSIHSERTVAVGGSTFNLEGKARGSSPIAGLQTGMAFDGITSGLVKPAIGIQFGSAQMSSYSETGGAAAMTFDKYRKDLSTMRFGVDADWQFSLGEAVLRPQVHAFMVAKLGSSNGTVGATFAGVSADPTTFDLAGNPDVWADLGVGLEADVYENTSVSFHFNANPGNTSAAYTAFGGSLRIKL